MADPTNEGIELELKGGLQDPRWRASEGWVKRAANINGIEIHWLVNKNTGATADFKFVFDYLTKPK